MIKFFYFIKNKKCKHIFINSTSTEELFLLKSKSPELNPMWEVR